MADGNCYGSLQTAAMRVSALTATGAPDTGAGKGVITDAVIDLSVEAEVEEGDEFTLKNALGGICQTYKDCDRVKRVNVEMTLCQLDADLLSLLVGSGSLITKTGAPGAGDTLGFEIPDYNDPCPNGVCLEFWSKAWDGDQQATPTALSGSLAYIHWVVPRAKFQIGKLEFKNDFLNIPVKGFGDSNAHITANGPFDDWPASIANRGGVQSSMAWFLDSALPTPACGFVAVTSAAS